MDDILDDSALDALFAARCSGCDRPTWTAGHEGGEPLCLDCISSLVGAANAIGDQRVSNSPVAAPRGRCALCLDEMERSRRGGLPICDDCAEQERVTEDLDR